MTTMREGYHFEDISSTFSFGKYKNQPLCRVIEEDSQYIYWCINNIPEFSISINCLNQIRMVFPMFIITISFFHHIRWKRDEEDYDEDDYGEDGYEEDEDFRHYTYERYNGSYAQSVMGYSDDDIDTIFDGDPLAYWNID